MQTTQKGGDGPTQTGPRAERIFTEHEAILELGLSFGQLERGRKSGALPFKDVRRGVRVYLGSDLSTWLKGEGLPCSPIG